MRVRWLVVVMFLAVGVVPAVSGQGTNGKKKPFRDQFKTAQDGVTRGWLVEYPWPDQDDVSQSWRTIPWRLVIARHGKVVRKIQATQSFWSWNFWNGGREGGGQERAPHRGAPRFGKDGKTRRETERAT